MRHRLPILLFALGGLLLSSTPARGDVETGFEDVVDDHLFAKPITWMRLEGITAGCNPPQRTRFCPDQPMTRGQMAAFLARVLELQETNSPDRFVDDGASVFEGDINQLAAAGITRGCNPPTNDQFCPAAPVTRGQLAAFLSRAYDLPPSDANWFTDDDGSPFENVIDRLADSGITHGCNPPQNSSFCPDATVTRGQMAAMLWRAAGSPATSPASRIVAAGDIARCELHSDEATAALVDRFFRTSNGVVAALGDTVYESGSPAEFAECYHDGWGRHRFRTRPAVGNHEYRTAAASGYFDYFGATAGNPDEGWYSYDVGSWKVVALNSNCDEVQCDASSEQAQWLRSQLESDPRLCTLAYMHHPRFSSGTHGDDPDVAPLWQVLADYDAELVLAGHDHNYERLAPMTPHGDAGPDGIRSFVVGTGGTYLRPVDAQRANSDIAIDDSHGVLILDLDEDSYRWRFVDIAGETLDSGVGLCR